MILISGASGFIGSNLKTILKSNKIKFKTIKTREIKKKNKFFFKNVTCFIHLGFNFYKKKIKTKQDHNLGILKIIIKFDNIFIFRKNVFFFWPIIFN